MPKLARSFSEDPELPREKFLVRVRRRLSLRLHMSLILLGTTSAGVGANWLLWRMGISWLAVRVVFAVAITYFVFLALVRLWLAIVGHQRETDADTLLDAADVLTLVPDPGVLPVVQEVPAAFSGAGGNFGGAGASASFESGAAAAGESLPAEAAKSAGGFALDLDGVGVILFIAFCALIASFFVAGGYLVYEAPIILAETLFEFSMASVMLKKLKKVDQSDWLGHLLKLTWKPFACVMLVTFIFSGLILTNRPEAERLPDLWRDKTVSVN